MFIVKLMKFIFFKDYVHYYNIFLVAYPFPTPGYLETENFLHLILILVMKEAWGFLFFPTYFILARTVQFRSFISVHHT